MKIVFPGKNSRDLKMFIDEDNGLMTVESVAEGLDISENRANKALRDLENDGIVVQLNGGVYKLKNIRGAVIYLAKNKLS